MNVLATMTVLSLALSADPVGPPAGPQLYVGTPPQVVQIIRYNAAQTDQWLQDKRVEITGPLSRIEKDGLGNYVAVMETRIEEPAGEVSGTIRFRFDPGNRLGLSTVTPPTDVVTIRGDLRFINDLLRRMTRNTVTVNVLNCELVPPGDVKVTRAASPPR